MREGAGCMREGAGWRMRGERWGRLWLVALGGAWALSGCACASPEARRSRGGGPGADPGNHGAEVAVHGRVDPFHGTPRKVPTR
ncbi:hypothetical protein [Chondromyces apiculatus]|uniref:Uncharacterized protein n=1 Tax=Chondromyces apiculatus DSM 436 TaxID=1192034 RepID=A0A017T7D2_9BACT|nr:hypothetical protein [Chondromyces apiculatus]EYF05129.1 Hypothetical protein CAP_3492 [Chondromyces apiculatus DSM 436]